MSVSAVNTYEYTITIDDNEHLTLEVALRLLLEYSRLHIAKGQGASFHAYRQSCNTLLEKLNDAKLGMMSTTSVFYKK